MPKNPDPPKAPAGSVPPIIGQRPRHVEPPPVIHDAKPRSAKDVWQAATDGAKRLAEQGAAAIKEATKQQGSSTSFPATSPFASVPLPGGSAPRSMSAPPPLPSEAGLPPVIRRVTINGVALRQEELQMLERVHRIRIPDGAFWYDKVCGSWGRDGGPCKGTLPHGLAIGGPLKADASDGHSRVFINGRQLGLGELLKLRQIVALWPGRYWLDAESNYGREGEPAKGNLREQAKRVAMWNAASIALQTIANANSGGGGHHGSVLSTWDRTGVAVYDLS